MVTFLIALRNCVACGNVGLKDQLTSTSQPLSAGVLLETVTALISIRMSSVLATMAFSWDLVFHWIFLIAAVPIPLPIFLSLPLVTGKLSEPVTGPPGLFAGTFKS